jgi:hypothetical protein
MPKMTDCNYAATQNALIQAGRLLDSLDLNSFRRRLSVAQTVGFTGDPKFFQEAQRRLAVIERMAEIGVEMVAQVRVLRAMVEEQEASNSSKG